MWPARARVSCPPRCAAGSRLLASGRGNLRPRILFRSPTDEFAGSNLYTVRPDGTGLKQLTHFPPATEVLSASYSPDGKWIVLSKTGRTGLPDLFAVGPDGTGLRQITRTSAWDSAPDWGLR